MSEQDKLRLHVGMRCAVAEADLKALEKLHLYNNIECPKCLSDLIGRVGLVVALNDEKVTTRFYSYGKGDENLPGPRPKDTKPELFFIDVVLIGRAINPCPLVHFLAGDYAALIQQNDPSQMRLVSLQASRDGALLVNGQGINTFRYEEPVVTPCLFPVYVGRNLNQVACDRAANVKEDHSPGRLLHGPLRSLNGSELLEAVREDSITGKHQSFMRVTAKHSKQVNNAIQDRTPLQLAAELGNWAACVSLVAMGGNRNGLDSQRNTLLHLAALGGSVSTLEGLLLLIPDKINCRNINGDTALHCATKRCHAACVNRLLSGEGIQPSIQNLAGDTPLHVIAAMPDNDNKLAILCRMLTCVRVMVNVSNAEGLTPIQLAISRGYHLSTVEFLKVKSALLDSGGRMGTVYHSSGSSNRAVMSQLLPIHTAAFFGWHRVLEAVIEQGGDINSVSRNGRTPLHFCVDHWDGSVGRVLERLASIQLLVTLGCGLNCQDIDGLTPLHLVIMQMNASTQPPDDKLRLIRRYGGGSNVKLDKLAAEIRPYWSLAVMAYLCLNGGDPTICDISGASAISICKHAAVQELLNNLIFLRTRPYLPPSSLVVSKFDPAGVTMCTFSCAENVANVVLNPCNHRVICTDCIRTTPLRRCPICYVLIEEALADGKSVNFKAKVVSLESRIEVPSSMQSIFNGASVTMGDVERIAAEAAQKAKQEAYEENKQKIEELRAQLDALETATQCAICFDSKTDVVFGCGHTACKVCSTNLTVCHICRENIVKRQMMFS